MDYPTLKAHFIDNVENDDAERFTPHIDEFFLLAELRIYREIDLRAFRFQAFANTRGGDPYVNLPSTQLLGSGDAARTFSVLNPIIRTLHILLPNNSRKFLLPKNLDFVRDYWPNDSRVGEPRYYAHWNSATLLMAPTPNISYRAELQYSAQPPSITAGGDPRFGTNRTWLGDNAWDALLYAALIEAYGFMRAEEKAAAVNNQAPGIWASKYQEALVRLATQEGRERVDDYRAEKPT